MKILLAAVALAGATALGVQSASAASAAYCDGYARNFANKRAGGNAVGGAIVGGVGGAVLGGILGGKKGVGTGAIIGGAGGAIVGGSTWKRFYNEAYFECVNSGPGYVQPVQPIYAPPPPPQPAYDPPPYATARVYKNVNIRVGPGLGYEVIGSIQPGMVVSIGQCDPEWCSVGSAGGQGWAYRPYLDFGG